MKTFFRSLFLLTLSTVCVEAVTIELLSPPDDSVYYVGTAVPFYVDAHDDDGLVAEVQFFLNGELIGTSMMSPYLIDVSLPGEGEYLLQAVAVDNDGNTAMTQVVDVTARRLDDVTPRIIMTHPLPLGGGDTVNDVSVASKTFINAEISDPDLSEIDRVRFYVNGAIVASSDPADGAPDITQYGDSYAAFIDFNAPGSHVMFATVTDADGNTAFGIPLALDVGPLESPMPDIVLKPLPPEAPVNEPVQLEAEVDGKLNSVERVDFFANGVIVGSSDTIENDKASVIWVPNVIQDEVVITARAVQIDPGGQTYDNWRISDSFEINIIGPEGVPPTIVISNPGAGEAWTVGNRHIIQAVATPGSGTITEVAFYQNGQLIGTDAMWPYDIEFTPTSIGNLRLFARATNSSNLFGLSDVRTVEVTGNGPTAVDVYSPSGGSLIPLGWQVPLIASVETTGSGRALQVSYYVNGDLIETTAESPYVVYWTPTSPGNYDISAVVEELGGLGARASSREVSVTVEESEFAQFTFLGPSYGSATAGSDVQLEAAVADVDGSVNEVRFFVDGEPQGTDSTAPFTAFWRPGSAGTYRVRAEATDNANKVTVFSQEITVSEPVGQLPTVTLDVTADGNVTPNSRVVANANVTDENPENVTVTFFLDGEQIGSPDTEFPYSTIFNVGDGPRAYSVTVLATDEDGNSRSSVIQPLYISDVSASQPMIDIISPMSGSELTFGSRASLRAEITGGAASDVSSVIFYANGVEVGRDQTSPYSFDWIPDQLGEVEITAAALQNNLTYDHDNNVDTAEIPVTPVTVANSVATTVNPVVGTLPRVSFQILPTATGITQGSQVMLYADAQDFDGSVASVQFFRNGVAMGSADTEAPFSLVWTAVEEGDFFIHAVATDNEGNVVNSNFEPIQIAARVVNPTPTVSLTVPDTAQAGDFITLRSSVRDFVSGPEGVDFYINGQPVGSAATRPFNFEWIANLEGEVSVFATAQQALAGGAIVIATSPVTTISLAADADPVISSFTHTFPGQGAAKPNPLINETISFTVEASDNGRVESIELLRDNVTVATVANPNSPVIINDTPPGLGNYTYAVVVTDNSGRQVQTSVGDTIQIEVVTGASPVVTIENPGADTYLPNQTITVRANATDADGSIEGVQFYVNGVAQGELDTEPPYEFSFTPSGSGDYSISARAIDNSGNLSPSATAANVTVISDNTPIFTEFAINLESGTGEQNNPFIARVNQVFTINVRASDDQGVRSMSLLKNTEPMPNPGGVDVPLQYSDVLTVPGIYSYRAEATDAGNNVGSSETLVVQAILGTAPDVIIESPLNGVDVAAGDPVTVRATATPAEEPVGSAGSISQVEFFANGRSFAVLDTPPYTAEFVPSSEGVWQISVVATSDTGLTSDAIGVNIDAVDGNIPEILSFTNDTTGGRSLVDVPITFDITATDEVGVERVELVLDSATLLGTAVGEPYRIVYTPTAPGIYRFSARAINTEGNLGRSEPVEIQIATPDPLGSVDDFVFQTFLDLLGRTPTAAEESAFGTGFNADIPLEQQTADELLVTGIVEGDEFEAMRAAIYTRYLLVGAWPSRDQVTADLRLILEHAGGSFGDLSTSMGEKANGVQTLVQTLMPAFEQRYRELVGGGSELRVPDAFSSESEINRFVGALWELKYGQPASDSGTLVSRFRSFGRDGFVARFILDMGNLTTPSGSVRTPVLALSDPPNDNAYHWSTAAALHINLLRVVPTQEEVETLAREQLFQQAATILADSRYGDRFTTAFPTLEHREDGWKWSEWLGWFYPHESGWNWSHEQHWIYFPLNGQTPDNFWYYHEIAGWLWTSSDAFPAVYSHNRGAWLYFGRFEYLPDEKRWFYSYATGEWFRL